MKNVYFAKKNESGMLHVIQADTKDIQLKTAFLECPVALPVYKIRSLGALAAMAGELKHHQPCWNKIIANRQVEVCFSSPRSNSSTTTRTKLDQMMSPFMQSPAFRILKQMLILRMKLLSTLV